MIDIALSVLIKPLVLLVLFLAAALIAVSLKRFIPASRLRTFLYRKRPYGDGLIAFGWIASFVLLCVFIRLYLGPSF
jgi:hypothetical protein